MDVEAATHPAHRILRAMLGHERVLHLASLAKYAAAFLRNSHVGLQWQFLQIIPERLCAAPEIPEYAIAVSFLIMGRAGVFLCHAVSEGIVEQDGNLTRGGRDCFGFTCACRQSPVESAQSGIAAPNCDRSQTQEGRSPTGRSPCP